MSNKGTQEFFKALATNPANMQTFCDTVGDAMRKAEQRIAAEIARFGAPLGGEGRPVDAIHESGTLALFLGYLEQHASPELLEAARAYVSANVPRFDLVEVKPGYQEWQLQKKKADE